MPSSFGLFLSSLKKKTCVFYELFVLQPRVTMSKSNVLEAIQDLARRFNILKEDVEMLTFGRGVEMDR